MTTTLTIGQVSELTGLSAHTLRYYEREGLLPRPVHRTTGGQRAYSEADVGWLGLCERFRSCGMPIADIKRYVDLVAAGIGNEAERLALLAAHEGRLRAQVAELQNHLTMIASKVALYERVVRDGTSGEPWSFEAGHCLALEEGVSVAASPATSRSTRSSPQDGEPRSRSMS